tara:strand:- start:5956 stop:6594 length:639 start_codon:yes stop_codon:yes gene_type:complete
MKKIIIFSAGSLSREILELINFINQKKKIYEVIGFVDDKLFKTKSKLAGIKIYDSMKFPYKNIFGICGIMNPLIRSKIIKKEGKKIKFINIVHPNVYIPKTFKMGKGNVIFGNVHISFDVKISNFSIISNFCDLGHNLTSGDYLTCMPGTIIGGNCTLGKNVFIGSSSVVHQNINIGDNTHIGSRSHLTSDLKKNCAITNYPRQIVRINNKK